MSVEQFIIVLLVLTIIGAIIFLMWLDGPHDPGDLYP